MDMNIVYSTDDNYVKYITVSMVSAIVNNPDSHLVFHVLCDNVSNKAKESMLKYQRTYNNVSICFYDVDAQEFESFKTVSTYPGITLPAYFRLHLSRLLDSSVKLILYLDGDTIINSNLSKLFDTRMENICIAGVPDVGASGFESAHEKYNFNRNTYINSGVVLMNLAELRKINADEIIDSFVRENFDDIKYGDQDILNLVFVNHILLLPSTYNVHGTNCFYRNTYKKPAIIHHVCKAWNLGQKTYYQDKYFKFLRLTEYSFDSRLEEYWWRIRTNVIAFGNLVSSPKTLFSKEYWYGIYRFARRKY